MPSTIDTDPFLVTHPTSAERLAIQASLVQAKAEIEDLQEAVTEDLQEAVDYDLRQRYGAIGDGVVDDTAKIQDFLTEADSAPNGHSRLMMRGEFAFDPSTLVWPASKLVTLVVDGILWPSTTLTLSSYQHLMGVGGYRGVQFQRGPSCAVEQYPASTDPVIKMIGSANHMIKDAAVTNCEGIGILIDGSAALGALAKLENVGVLCANVSTSVGIKIDSWFWAWLMDCVVIGRPLSGPCIHMVQTNAAAGSYLGLVQACNTITAVQTILIEGTSDASRDIGEFVFKSTHQESGEGPVFTINSTNINISNIVIDEVFQSDPVDTYPFIELIGAGLISLRVNAPEPPSGTQLIGGAGAMPRSCHIEMGEPVLQAASAIEPFAAYPLKGSVWLAGEHEDRDAWRGSAMVPHALPAAPVSVEQDILAAAVAWGTTATVTAGHLAPDGTLTAYRVTNSGAASTETFRVADETFTASTGDYLVAGVWCRAVNPATQVNRHGGGSGPPTCIVFQPANCLLDGSAVRYLDSPRLRMLRAGWIMVTRAFELTISGTPILRCDVVVDTGFSFDIWMPFAVVLPGSEWTRRDAARWANSLTMVPPSGAGPGVLRMAPHQTLATGSGLTADRPSAVTVGPGAQWYDVTLSQPVWSDGAVWLDAGGMPV